MACAICKTRREKRHCPGVQGEICTVCCGTGREETIDCPLDCEYLQAGRAHETLGGDFAGVPNRDFPIPKNFLRENIQQIMAIQHAILKAALERNAVDFDIREALDGLVQTYKTLGSGLYYESRPTNSIAAAIFDGVQQRVTEIRKLETERRMHKFLDSQFLAVFVFLQHMEYALNNQRKRGRSFVASILDTMARFAGEERPDSSSLIAS